MNRWLPEKNADGGDGDGVSAWKIVFVSGIDVLTIVDQHGFLPSKSELLDIIQELQKTYDSIDWESVDSLNKERLSELIDYYDFSPISTARKNLREGFIYLIRFDSTNQYKIGMSSNQTKRLEQLQTSLPDRLFLIHAIKVKDMAESELFFHLKYKSKRIRGEWFELSEDEVKEFCNYKEGDL